MDTKKCSRCKTEKPITEFNYKNKTKKTRQASCKVCTRQEHKKHYLANKDAYFRKLKEAKLEKRNYIQQIKEQTECADCGCFYPYYVMDFDHLGNKKFNLAQYCRHTLDEIRTEVAKCEIVCSNCHRIRTHTRKNK